MTPAAAIELCIRRVRRAKDGRGPWQAERACQQWLALDVKAEYDPRLARDCAAAARRIGEWLRSVGKA